MSKVSKIDSPGFKFLIKVFKGIEHGDDTHRAWLYWKLLEYVEPLNRLLTKSAANDHNKNRRRQSSAK